MRTVSIAAVVLILWFAAPADAQLVPAVAGYDALVTDARSLAKSGKYAEAIGICEQAIARANTRYEAYVAAASAYAAQALFDDAMGMLQAALVRAPQEKKQLIRDAITYIRQQLGTADAGNAGIAYVDAQRLLSDSALGKRYNAQITAEWTKSRAVWDAKNREVQALDQRIKDVAAVIQAQALEQMKTGLARLQAELKAIDTKMYADNDALQKRLMQEFESRLAPVISEVAAAERLQVVLKNENLLWVNSGIDITTKMIQALDLKGIK